MKLIVSIECDQCGRYLKLERLMDMPDSDFDPLELRTGATCDRCQRQAIMIFERKQLVTH